MAIICSNLHCEKPAAMRVAQDQPEAKVMSGMFTYTSLSTICFAIAVYRPLPAYFPGLA